MDVQRIVNSEILDILPYDNGFLYVSKEELDNGGIKASFFAYDQDEDSISPAKKKFYLETKFGKAYHEIAKELGDFITCDSAPLGNKGVAVLYSSGEMYIFNSEGRVLWSGELLYHEQPMRDLAVDGNCIWGTVPNYNAVINYSPAEQRVMLRIGGGSSTAFSKPVGITKILNKLYVCNENSCKVRTIRLDDYSVKDYITFNESVYKYFRVYDNEYVLLESGVYLI